jgi:hypothetical protein
VDVRKVAVATTCESGIGAATKDASFESRAIAEAAEAERVLGVAAFGVGAGAAMGVRSVVASTTI